MSYSDEAIERQAWALMEYLARPDNRGAQFWLDSKDFGPEDRTAILLRVGDSDVVKPEAVEAAEAGHGRA